MGTNSSLIYNYTISLADCQEEYDEFESLDTEHSISGLVGTAPQLLLFY